MDVTFDGEQVRAGRDARERFYDSRGYGTPRGGDLELAPVEAAHLLYRGDLDIVRDSRTGDRLGFQAFLGSGAVPEVDFFVYKDLRDRGFYLSPADGREDFHVYPRGNGPWDDEVAYRVRAVSERTDVSADGLAATADGEGTGVLAVVDEESEVSYFELATPGVEGSTFGFVAMAVAYGAMISPVQINVAATAEGFGIEIPEVISNNTPYMPSALLVLIVLLAISGVLF